MLMQNFVFLYQPVSNLDNVNGIFFVIEKFWEPEFVMGDDGEIKKSENYQNALTEAKECQKGYVICFG